MLRRLRALVTVPLLFVFMAVPCAARTRPAQTPAFGASAISEASGYPVFTFGGRPFFVYGAAFFYERLPRESWRPAMFALKYRLHINTLDLYVPWNWHEISDGNFDFDGRTNPRRDLREVLRLARAFGFALIVRPGPVVRNEWRNGGYPAWLLERPEYGMPLRDRLEGRYPPTATLQNAHSDDAAAAWLRNATHRRYAGRWLSTVLREFAPVADRVVAIALDDDQGAYIDNQTWPAPHLRSYLDWLRARVARVTGDRVPVFINTYQMKVTASSPVWAMGNWYQSDAYAIGEHDRAQLEFSTGLVQSRPHQPVMASEFQAGWLQQPQDVLPQAADPSNTLLALHTLVAFGARGIVNFPAQDTLSPAGYEVPFANEFYAWDAALAYAGATARPALTESPRAWPTRFVGAEIAAFNPLLAAAHTDADAAIAWLPSAYAAARLTNEDFAALAERTLAAQRFCRRVRLTCELVDLRYERVARLRTYPLLILPLPVGGPLRRSPFVPAARALLAAYARAPGRTVLASAQPSPPALARALRRARHRRYVDGADATLAEDARSGAAFLTFVNYDAREHAYARAVITRANGRRIALPPVAIAPRAALVLPLDIPLQAYNGRFARGDRFSATCAVTGVYAPPPPKDDRVELTLEPGARACRIAARVATANRSVLLAAGQTRVAIALRGTLLPLARPSPARADAAALAEPAAGTLPLRGTLHIAEAGRAASVGRTAAIAYRADVFGDGEGAVVLENDLVRIVVAPDAGGRAFVFEDKARVTSAFTTVGALRDDVLIAPPLSRIDRIAKYTNQMPAGFFNRPYRAKLESSGARAAIDLSYDAPDAFPAGAHFERRVALAPHARCFSAELSNRFAGTSELARRQRAVSATSLAVGDPRAPGALLILERPEALARIDSQTLPAERHGLGLYDPVTRELALVAWSASPEPVTVTGRKNSLLVRVAQAPGVTSRLSFGYEAAANEAAATVRSADFAERGCGSGDGGDAGAKGNVPAARN